jgi:hypothetical protein
LNAPERPRKARSDLGGDEVEACGSNAAWEGGDLLGAFETGYRLFAPRAENEQDERPRRAVT